ncbi:MAG: nuclear transport factor 2 family protein [Cyclobacteriaceae bacterium]|nr:nuclear transport factor 2 family protein [Cyclobacteriaceae bacterium]
MKYLFIAFILINTSITVRAQNGLEADKNEILKVRKESNLALKNHQIEKILSFLTEDINIAASNGKIFSGKIAFKDALTTIFSNSPDLYFVRNSEEVLLNSENNIAWEKGTWIALRPKTDNWNNYGGNYSAYWVKTDGIWKIKSELFVKLY